MGQSLDCLKVQGTEVSDERKYRYFSNMENVLLLIDGRCSTFFDDGRNFSKQRLEWNLYELHKFISEGETSFQFAIMMIRTRLTTTFFDEIYGKFHQSK